MSAAEVDETGTKINVQRYRSPHMHASIRSPQTISPPLARHLTSLVIVRRISARPSIVFDALTTPEGIACWWGPDEGPVLIAETDVRVGGRFRVRFRQLDGSEHETFGEYLEVRKPWRLVMSWRWVGGQEDPGESRVEIDLRRIPEGTECTVAHFRLFSEETRLSHAQGWIGALDKLARRLNS